MTVVTRAKSASPYVLDAIKDYWKTWTGESVGSRNECDFEGSRRFQQNARQSFFSLVQDGRILYLPLADDRIQTWESHQIRNPRGYRPTGMSNNGIVHGTEVRNGRIVAYHVIPGTRRPTRR